MTASSAPTAQRILCVSSLSDGATGRSQRELGRALAAAGRDIRFLVVGDGKGPTFVAQLRRRIDARLQAADRDGLPHYFVEAPEKAFAALVGTWRPDLVVASCISRATWRAVRSACRQRDIATALYIREASAIGHLTAGLNPDLLVANSGALVDEAARLGHHASLVPSLARITPMAVPSTAEVLLMINPIPSRGVDLVKPLAKARPDIPVVLQETWPLEGSDRARVFGLAAHLPNVSFRAFEPRPGRVFRDAKLLLVPHRVDCQPRTVLEAHANAIPVVGSGLPTLTELVGDGGCTVAPASAPGHWARAVSSLWDDHIEWARRSAAALAHAARPAVRPAQIAARFSELADALAVDGVRV